MWSAAAPLRTKGYPVRWVHADLIHLTVKFLGEVDESRISEIAVGLRRALDGTRAFHLPVREFGAFPTTKRPRVVWVGCEALPVLELLQDSVEREMSTLGFAIEGRPFRPHVTIGRTARGAKNSDFKGLKKDLEKIDYVEEPVVAGIDVMQSILSPRGPHYVQVARVELTS